MGLDCGLEVKELAVMKKSVILTAVNSEQKQIKRYTCFQDVTEIIGNEA